MIRNCNWSKKTAAVVLAAVACSRIAVASDHFFPIELGWEWQYVRDNGSVTACKITGYTSIMSHEVSILTWAGTTVEEYLSITETGDVLWHGVEGESGGDYVAVFVDPPLKVMDGDAVVSDTWAIYSQKYCDREGDVPYGYAELFTYTVASIDSVDVPAGKFLATEVTCGPVFACGELAWVPLSGGAAFQSLQSNKSDGPWVEISKWYTRGVGVVKSKVRTTVSESTSKLVDYSQPPLATTKTSLGNIKAMFR